MSTSEETDRLSAVLYAVGQGMSSEFEVTAFLAMVGHRYDHRLMVVGQAVNGWTDSRCCGELTVPHAAAAFADSVRKSVESHGGSEGCPMLWVTRLWASRQVEILICTIDDRPHCQSYIQRLRDARRGSPYEGATQMMIVHTYDAAGKAGCVKG
jgi:hypothetical protein